MPKRSKPPATHVQDPDRIKAMHAEGEGFYAPVPPPREAVLAYIRLYNEMRLDWDEVPELGVLCNPYRQTVTGYPLPIPEATWWAMEDPGKVVRKMASLLWEQGRTDHALVRNIDPLELADMIGVYFTHEGYAPPRGKEKQALNLMRGGLNYRLSETEDRRETRSVMAVQIDGVIHTTTLFRDAPHELHHKTFDTTAVPQGDRIGGTLLRPLLEVAYGLVKTLRPAYANLPEDNL